MAWGPLGILVLAVLDSSGVPVAGVFDALLILIAVKRPDVAWLCAGLAVLGSTVGNTVLYWMAQRGGRRFMEKAAPEGRAAKFREWFIRYGMVTVFVPALVPIPMPLKLFVISAGVLGTALIVLLIFVSAGALTMSYTAPVFPSIPDQDQEISMSNKTGDAVSDLSTDLAAVRADIARLSDTMAALMRSQADAAGAAVRGAVDGARDQLSQAAAQAQDSAFGAAADLERRIERNPLTAVLIAAGIGMALGMMSKSRG